MADNTVRIRAQLDDKVSTPLARMSDKFDTLGKSKGFQAVATGVGVGIGAQVWSQASSVIVSGIQDTITAASDQREAMSLNTQVFKGASQTVDDWSDTTAKAFGVAKTDAINYAAQFGNVMKAAGLSADDLASKSIELTRRVADLGSAFNASGDEVSTAIKAGLVGEAEPLRRFGILLSEAEVKAKGMSMGLADAHGELTAGEKVLARYQLIMEQSSESAGMFGRDVDSLADKQKVLTARWEDAQVQLGNQLLPRVTELAEALLTVADASELVAEKAGDAGGPLQAMADAVSSGMRPDKILSFIESVKDMGLAVFNSADHSLDDVERMRGGFATNFGKIEDVIADGEDAAKDWRDTWHDVTGETIRRTNAMRDKMVDAAGDISDDFFDPIETRADIFDAHQATLAAIEAQRLAKNKKQHREASRDIVSSLDDQADGLHDLSRQGKITEKDVDKFEADVKASYKALGQKVPAELQRIIDRYRAIARLKPVSINLSVQQGTRTSPRDTHAPGHGKLEFAEGGRVPGAKGAPVEATLHGGEFVVSNDMQRDMGSMGSGGRGAGVNYYVTVNAGAASGLTAGSARELANQLGPAIYADMQRRGLLPRGGMALRG